MGQMSLYLLLLVPVLVKLFAQAFLTLCIVKYVIKAGMIHANIVSVQYSKLQCTYCTVCSGLNDIFRLWQKHFLCHVSSILFMTLAKRTEWLSLNNEVLLSILPKRIILFPFKILPAELWIVVTFPLILIS